VAGSDDGGTGNETPREVVEPDVIRRDGNLLYILNQHRGLTLVDLDAFQILSNVPVSGYPRDLYLEDGRAWVLTGYAAEVTKGDDGLLHCTMGSRIVAVDVADPEAPQVLGSVSLPGDFIDSRLVGNALYAVCAEFSYSWEDGVVSSEAVKEQTSSSWVTSVDISNPASLRPVETVRFEGYGSLIQASADALFVASPVWGDTQTTTIQYVDISDPGGRMAVRGACSVPGYLADRFKMDAWNGALRVVSNTWWPDRQTYVTTVDLANPDAPAVLGQTTLAAAVGETAFATRFEGPRAYVVTYLTKDPLFVLDLSDPAAPAVTGMLEVPGWSTHIEPRGDRLVALGVDDTDGRNRVCVSLFNVADPAAPFLVQRETFGDDWSWSSAYGDVKAFTVLDNLLIVPFSGWNDSGGYDRLQFVAWTPDSLGLLGHVDLRGGVLRSFEYNGGYYGVTSEELAAVSGDLASPAVGARIVLAEYVADYQPLSPGRGLETLQSFSDGAVSVRLNVGGVPASEPVELTRNSLVKTFAVADGMIVAASGYDWEGTGQGFYEVFRVNCPPGAAAPEVVWKQRVELNPWWGGWRGYPMPVDDVGMPEGAASEPGAAGAAKRVYGYWGWYGGGEAAVMTGKWLGLVGYPTQTMGPADAPVALPALAVLDTETGVVAGTPLLGSADVRAVAGDAGAFWITSCYSAPDDRAGRPQCAYYLRSLSPDTLALGPAANVPGTFLFRDAASGAWVFEDTQYGEGWSWMRILNTLAWDGAGGAVTHLSRLELPETAGELAAADAAAFFLTWGETTGIGAVRVGADGALADGGGIALTDGYAQLAGTRGTRAYVTVCGAALARVDLAEGGPVLGDTTYLGGYPLALRFSAEGVYAPLGYGGLALLPQ
ncbi:MAG TPA: beta-propeller domain-containing protein, partial [Candidatus Hydrogenedentes bacterium]|nr:beta-propeller domain-containing protein [Candidatus Hydrogenedentota bacterium]